VHVCVLMWEVVVHHCTRLKLGLKRSAMLCHADVHTAWLLVAIANSLIVLWMYPDFNMRYCVIMMTPLLTGVLLP
jgi:hypothetical protein